MPTSLKMASSLSLTLDDQLRVGNSRFSGSILLVIFFADQGVQLVPVGPEDILLAPSKVRVYLAPGRSAFSEMYVCREVAVKGQQEEPYDANRDAQQREIRRELQHARIAAQGQRRS